jgi:hypothetical protein
MKERVKFRTLSSTAIEDVWLRRATAAAIENARAVITADTVPPNTPIGRLSDVEWGWIANAVLFGWIQTRAEQATKNGIGIEEAVRATNLWPDPWDVGAIASILPELANSEVDWSKPLTAFSRDEMITLLASVLTLIRKVMIDRDRGQERITRHMPDGVTRQTASVMQDPNDDLPF